ncbi:MAG: lolA [Francisellaceae bacterium]|nr:lolA [Francisellaceae bacterium]
MRKKINFILFIGCLLASSFLYAADNLLVNDSEQLKDLLKGIKTFEATFNQHLENEKGQVTHLLNGKVYLKNPGLIRWQVLQPDERLIVVDGKKIWNYDKDLEQVIVRKIDKDLGQTPLYFLSGEVNQLDNQFIIRAVQTQHKHFKLSDKIFELIPKNKEAPFQWIKIGFDHNSLKELVLLDQLGQLSFFVFNNSRLNQSISKTIFTFNPPKGIDIIQE